MGLSGVYASLRNWRSTLLLCVITFAWPHIHNIIYPNARDPVIICTLQWFWWVQRFCFCACLHYPKWHCVQEMTPHGCIGPAMQISTPGSDVCTCVHTITPCIHVSNDTHANKTHTCRVTTWQVLGMQNVPQMNSNTLSATHLPFYRISYFHVCGSGTGLWIPHHHRFLHYKQTFYMQENEDDI